MSKYTWYSNGQPRGCAVEIQLLCHQNQDFSSLRFGATSAIETQPHARHNYSKSCYPEPYASSCYPPCLSCRHEFGGRPSSRFLSQGYNSVTSVHSLSARCARVSSNSLVATMISFMPHTWRKVWLSMPSWRDTPSILHSTSFRQSHHTFLAFFRLPSFRTRYHCFQRGGDEVCTVPQAGRFHDIDDAIATLRHAVSGWRLWRRFTSWFR